MNFTDENFEIEFEKHMETINDKKLVVLNLFKEDYKRLLIVLCQDSHANLNLINRIELLRKEAISIN